MKPIDIGLIQARRQKIAAEITAAQEEFQRKMKANRDEYERRSLALETEAKELAIAERVFSRLTGGDGEESSSKPQSQGKPDGLPPVSEMIKEALSYAVLQGAYGLKPAALLSYIRGKWWSSAEANDVGPIAWRMWNNGQLIKYEDGSYDVLEVERDSLLKKLAASKTPPPPPTQPVQAGSPPPGPPPGSPPPMGNMPKG